VGICYTSYELFIRSQGLNQHLKFFEKLRENWNKNFITEIRLSSTGECENDEESFINYLWPGLNYGCACF
jgi:hypothetical protein